MGSHLHSFEWYHPRPHTTSSSPRLGFTTPNQSFNRYYLRNGEGYAFQILYTHSKTFRTLIYKVHHMVIFAIARLSCYYTHDVSERDDDDNDIAQMVS